MDIPIPPAPGKRRRDENDASTSDQARESQSYKYGTPYQTREALLLALSGTLEAFHASQPPPTQSRSNPLRSRVTFRGYYSIIARPEMFQDDYLSDFLIALDHTVDFLNM